MNLPIAAQLSGATRILLAGAGGGYDVYGALPLLHKLRTAGKEVHLANYSSQSRSWRGRPIERGCGQPLVSLRLLPVNS